MHVRRHVTRLFWSPRLGAVTAVAALVALFLTIATSPQAEAADPSASTPATCTAFPKTLAALSPDGTYAGLLAQGFFDPANARSFVLQVWRYDHCVFTGTAYDAATGAPADTGLTLSAPAALHVGVNTITVNESDGSETRGWRDTGVIPTQDYVAKRHVLAHMTRSNGGNDYSPGNIIGYETGSNLYAAPPITLSNGGALEPVDPTACGQDLLHSTYSCTYTVTIPADAPSFEGFVSFDVIPGQIDPDSFPSGDAGYYTDADWSPKELSAMSFPVAYTAGPTVALTLSSITTTPTNPLPGQPFTLDLGVRNDSTDAATNVTPAALQLAPSADLTQSAGPTPASVASLASGATTHFTYTLTASKTEQVSVIGQASATVDGASTSTAAQTRLITVGSGITATLKAPSTNPVVGEVFPVTLTVANHTGHTQTLTPGPLTAAGATGFTALAPSPATYDLADGNSKDITYQVSETQAGPLALSTTLAATDLSDGSTSNTPATVSVSVGKEKIVVNTTGDEPLPASVPAAVRCDVDPDTDGDQCTLRAALQLADNQGVDGTAQSISFDIPGASVPRIAVGSPLPALTAPTTLDATTQAAGWVQLDGSGDSGDGLTVSGGSSTIRGFVLGGFASGAALVLDGAGGDRVVGNRIGTNLAGTAAAPNKFGVSLHAPSTVIGTLTSDGTLTCKADCNVISGNTTAGITDSDRDGAVPAGSSIVGNVIGTNVTGTAAVANNNGIDLTPPTSASATGLSTAQLILVGGSTARAGFAPGNLISGNSGTGVLTGASRMTGGYAAIRGNLVGSNWAGTVGLPNLVGINQDSQLDSVGGATPADGNVIVGNPTGVISSGVLDHNRVGVTLSGAAVKNTTGVVPKAGALCNNVISGNDIGVDASVGSADLAGGNFIGTDVTGAAALGNRIGVEGVARSVSDADCASTTVDVVSGNTQTGFDMSAPGLNLLDLSGIYIGTDVTGTKALGNGAGIVQSAELLSTDELIETTTDLGLGRILPGTSGTRDTCADPCVVIAANRGTGISLTGRTFEGNEVTLQHTNVGVGVGGQALGNAGDGVRVQEMLKPWVEIRTDGFAGTRYGITHSHIANNAGVGLDILVSPPTQDGYVVQTTEFDHNTAGNVRLVDGNHVSLFGNNIHDALFGVAVIGGTAPWMGGNSMYGNASGYLIGRGTATIGVPSEISAILAGTVVVVQGNRPASDGVTKYEIDVYGDTSCASGAQGRIPLGSENVTAGLTDTTFTVNRGYVPAGVGGIEVTATDLDNPLRPTSMYSSCVVPTVTTPVATLPSPYEEAGDDVPVTGEGFAPGESVDITLHSTPVHLTNVTADAAGKINTVVKVPANTPPGQHHLVLTGQSSGVIVSIPLTITGAGTASTSALANTGFPAIQALSIGLLALLVGGALLGVACRARREPSRLG